MAYRCGYCEEMFDGDSYCDVVESCNFKKVGHHGVEIHNAVRNECCEDCCDNETFNCYVTDECYCHNNFSEGIDTDGYSVCIEAVETAGYIQNEDGEYRPPNENEEQAVASGQYVDFYWHLVKGERHGVLQLDGGDEVAMAPSLEKKIYHRIEEAGADSGDPHVVNVYTRLQLIDEKILPPSYTL